VRRREFITLLSLIATNHSGNPVDQDITAAMLSHRRDRSELLIRLGASGLTGYSRNNPGFNFCLDYLWLKSQN
jgi:hypothetical protein